MSCMLLVESRTLESVQAWRLQRLALAFTLSCCVSSPVYHNACGRPFVTCKLTHVSMLACLPAVLTVLSMHSSCQQANTSRTCNAQQVHAMTAVTGMPRRFGGYVDCARSIPVTRY